MATTKRPLQLLPGTIDRYLLRKLFTPFLLIEGGVILFLELERALRLVYELSVSGADLRYFFPLLAQLTPYFVSFGLPVSFFLALLLLLSRLDDDLELQAMLANGMSLVRIVRPLVLAGVLVAGLAVLTNGWLEPLGRYAFRTMKVEAINSGRTTRLVSGAFFVPSDNLAIMVTRASQGRPSQVFVWHRGHGGEQQLIAARDAALGISADGERFDLSFVEGTALVDDPRADKARSHVVVFNRMFVSLPIIVADSGWARGRDERELTLPELLAPGPARLERLGRHAIDAELYGRLGKAALIPLMPLLVLPLTMAVRRGNRTSGGITAGLLFVLAQQSINMVRQRSAVGQIEALPNMAMLVAGFAILQSGLMATGRNLPSHSPISDALDRIDRLLPRLKLRRRTQMVLPGHLMASYIAGSVLIWSLLSLAALVVMSEMAEIFQAGSAFVTRGMTSLDVFHYALLRAPALTMQALPAAALLGPVIAFYLLVRKRELLTYRLMGVSLLRLFVMVLPVSLLLSLGSYVLAEHIVPRSQQAFVTWWQQGAVDSADPQARWFKSGSVLFRTGEISADGRRIEGLEIIRLGPDGAVTERIDAPTAIATSKGWQLEQAVRLTIESGRAVRGEPGRMVWKELFPPGDMQVVAAAGSSYSANWARRALAGDAPAGLGDPAYRTRIWRGTSMLVLPVLMLLLALPIAATSHVGGAYRPAVTFAIIAGAILMVADGLMSLMAMMGMVPILTGVWAVPLLALALALARLLHARG